MKLLTSISFSTSGSWTAPAGVTSIILSGTNCVGTAISVVPSTTYTIVIGSAASLTPTTFGSLYSIAPSADPFTLTVSWEEI